MAIQIVKGMKDVLPNESTKWIYVENIIRQLCKKHGFSEVRTPVLEHTELFSRGVGATTDIVQKEMYTFTDKGDRSVTLKPEGTAGVVRMFVEHKLAFDAPQPTKMYYLNAPIFRYERPQAGRLREHHQFGVEMFGATLASADAECIALVFELLKCLGIDNLCANINSIGCKECRPMYNAKLSGYLNQYKDELCPTCQTRMMQNPLRVLDCKEEKCKHICESVPKTLECICDECRTHFDNLQTCLNVLDIPFAVNPFIVRGLDYYTKTVFEVVSEAIGSQSAICGGGRYDGLVEEVGGPATAAVGFGMGLERLLLMLENLGVPLPLQQTCKVYIASMGDTAGIEAMKLAYKLRDVGVYAEFDHVGKSFKAQFKYADKIGARVVAIIGDDELQRGVVKLKRMSDGTECETSCEGMIAVIEEYLR